MGGFISRPKPAPAPRPEPKPEPKPIVETKAEKKYDEKKRRGRRSTILTSPTYGDKTATTDKPTLLGG